MSSASIEKDIVASLLHGPQKFMAIQEKLKPTHFSTNYLRWTFTKLMNWYGKYREPPKIGYFKNELAKHGAIDDDEKARWFSLIRGVYRRSVSEGDRLYAIEDLIRHAAKQELVKVIENALDKIEADEIEDAINSLNASMSVKIYEKDYSISNHFAAFGDRQKSRKERKENPEKISHIRFPWRTINHHVRGIAPGEVATIAALTNVGKSIVLMLCGKKAYIDGRNVLHITIEDTEELIAQRYDSAFLGVNYDDLRDYELPDYVLKRIDLRMQDYQKRKGERLRVAKTIPKKTSIITIEKIIKELEADGFFTDFLIVDYADVMIPTEKQEMFRLDQTAVYWDLKTLAGQRKIPVLTATQVAKEYIKRKAYAEGLSEAYDKARILNLILTLNQYDEHSRELLFHVAKNRDGKKGQDVEMVSTFEMMRLEEKVTVAR